MIRQDWRRLAPGLAHSVIEKGWWQDDGNKIDFVRSLGETSQRSRNAQKRWGRASLALSQQQGAIDLHFLRRMMGSHYTTNRDLVFGPNPTTLASSFLVESPPDRAADLGRGVADWPRRRFISRFACAANSPAAFGEIALVDSAADDGNRQAGRRQGARQGRVDDRTAANAFRSRRRGFSGEGTAPHAAKPVAVDRHGDDAPSRRAFREGVSLLVGPRAEDAGVVPTEAGRSAVLSHDRGYACQSKVLCSPASFAGVLGRPFHKWTLDQVRLQPNS